MKQQILIFHVEDHSFCIDLSMVRGIHSAGTLAMEQADNFQAKKVVLDAQMTSLIDLRQTLQLGSETRELTGRKIIHVAGEGHQIALLVDRVEQQMTADLIVPMPPVLAETACTCFPMVIKRGDQLIPMISAAGIGSVGQDETGIAIPETVHDIDQAEEDGIVIDDDAIIDLTDVVDVSDEHVPEMEHQPEIPLEAFPADPFDTEFPDVMGVDDTGIEPLTLEMAKPVAPEPPEQVPSLSTAHKPDMEPTLDGETLELMLTNIMADKQMTDKVVQIFTQQMEIQIKRKMQQFKHRLIQSLIGK